MPCRRHGIPGTDRHGFQQGQLDSLCAVYAVVNAAHHVATGLAAVAIRPRALFRRLVGQLDDAGLLGSALVDGLDHEQLPPLLATTRHWALDHWDVQLRVHRPFQIDAEVAPLQVLDSLHDHLARPHSVAIVAVEGGLDHWTCVRAAQGRRLMLLDSDGLHYFNERTFRLYRRPDGCGRRPLPASLHLVRARRA
ncbi:MAG: hypothetical protein VR70_08185 [Rhodospirillaceae bacterium BRH_c57]|nr:MAG: hypothetical protein VR70_08185 [Rhodospirillaceae bacterium BRH_c57]